MGAKKGFLNLSRTISATKANWLFPLIWKTFTWGETAQGKRTDWALLQHHPQIHNTTIGEEFQITEEKEGKTNSIENEPGRVAHKKYIQSLHISENAQLQV